MIFHTNKNATNYRLITVELENPTEEHWTTLLPEDEKDVLCWARCVDQNKLVVSYLQDVKVFFLLEKEIYFHDPNCQIPFDSIEYTAST